MSKIARIAGLTPGFPGLFLLNRKVNPSRFSAISLKWLERIVVGLKREKRSHLAALCEFVARVRQLPRFPQPLDV
jgi:hypothetical protein